MTKILLAAEASCKEKEQIQLIYQGHCTSISNMDNIKESFLNKTININKPQEDSHLLLSRLISGFTDKNTKFSLSYLPFD
ncbi:hypothetical protein QL285_087224 [Trifolium repens]|nr:hypothetical protein QL285_087224 [Trifolium repens]